MGDLFLKLVYTRFILRSVFRVVILDYGHRVKNRRILLERMSSTVPKTDGALKFHQKLV